LYYNDHNYSAFNIDRVELKYCYGHGKCCCQSCTLYWESI